MPLPTFDTTSFPGRLSLNQLCGLDRDGDGTYTAEGITKLCEALKGSAVTSLKCAAAPKCLLLCQRPLTRLSSHCHHLTHALRSLCFNELGVKGASAIAAVLKETMITDLKCARPQGVRFRVSAH